MNDAALAGALLAIDPEGLGGALLHAPAGPEREAWVGRLAALLPAGAPVRRLPARIEDDRLLGGLDLAASLATGEVVVQPGVLEMCHGGVVLVPQAERLEASVAARLAATLDCGEVRLERDGLAHLAPARLAVVAFDEGCEPGEAPPPALAERLAFHLDLSGPADRTPGPAPSEADAARRVLAALPAPADEVIEALCAAAVRIGVESLRAPMFALKAAQAHAALRGGACADLDDAAVAARLVLAPRACVLPPPETAAPEPPADAPPPQDGAPPQEAAATDIPLEILVEAIRSALPEGLVAPIAGPADRSGGARSRGAGVQAKSATRGRPRGVRPGRLSAGARLNLVETLRTAAPWQRLRGAEPGRTRLAIRPDDLRIQKFVQRRGSAIVFVVDASGSTALQRLAEAKGAVELLLERAYVSRARVALIAFRGLEAELILPPTRALARARGRLDGLAGGGGTPLASALDLALEVALGERRRGASPRIVLLTDGRANIARGGVAGRPAAEADAHAAARAIAEARIDSVFIDSSPRPGPEADRLAREMGGLYRRLPYVDAGALAEAIAPPAGRTR